MEYEKSGENSFARGTTAVTSQKTGKTLNKSYGDVCWMILQ
jgi:hypothetical protein